MIITIAPVIGHVDTLLEAMQDCLGSQHPPSGLTFQADRHVCLLQKNVIDCCGSLMICDFFFAFIDAMCSYAIDPHGRPTQDYSSSTTICSRAGCSNADQKQPAVIISLCTPSYSVMQAFNDLS